MERRLVKQGRNALTVSLPAKWLNKNNLVQGDYVYIEESQEGLVVKTSKVKNSESAKVDIRDFKRREAYHVLTDKYIQGYDIIEIVHNNSEVVSGVSEALMGMIIENISSTSCTLRDLIAQPSDNFENVLKRITQLLIQIAWKQHLCAKGEEEPSKRVDINLDNTILYAMRYLNKYSVASEMNKQKLFMILYSIETMADIMKYISFYIEGHEDLSLIILELVQVYGECIHKRDYMKIYKKIREEREKMSTDTYVKGLFFTLTEIMSNYVGYILLKD